MNGYIFIHAIFGFAGAINVGGVLCIHIFDELVEFFFHYADSKSIFSMETDGIEVSIDN